jgi:hypothetical protein
MKKPSRLRKLLAWKPTPYTHVTGQAFISIVFAAARMWEGEV